MSPMSPLDAYLDIERALQYEPDAPSADELRDALDPIWYALTDDDRAFLNRREVLP